MIIPQITNKPLSTPAIGVPKAESIAPFHSDRSSSLKEAFQKGFNETYWRHGIVISQGNGMSVSKDEAFQRLNNIRRLLLRKMFGNHWRTKGKINFMIFQHGSSRSEVVPFSGTEWRLG